MQVEEMVWGKNQGRVNLDPARLRHRQVKTEVQQQQQH
jgi:hypothetical protein